jgi:2-iminobutanoate/2-iminopropanoate deaminase
MMTGPFQLGHAESFAPPRRQVISTDQAPKAIGPYSQAIKIGDFVFTAGQIALNAAGQMVEGDVTAQTRQVLDNIKAVLEAAGASMASVVKTTVFLANIADFQAMNAVYAEFFPPDQAPPARSTVQVAALPRNASVEIEVIAALE